MMMELRKKEMVNFTWTNTVGLYFTYFFSMAHSEREDQTQNTFTRFFSQGTNIWSDERLSLKLSTEWILLKLPRVLNLGINNIYHLSVKMVALEDFYMSSKFRSRDWPISCHSRRHLTNEVISGTKPITGDIWN